MKSKVVIKLLAVAVSLSLVFIFIPSDGGAGSAAAGDINGDGKTDYDDAYLLFNYIAGTGTITPIQLENADLDCDGSVTIADAALLFHYINGTLSALPFNLGYDRLVIQSYPEKTEYTEGEELDLDGFVLAAESGKGRTKNIVNYTYEGFTPGPGIKIIVISHCNAKTAFTVTVFPADVNSIELVSLPKKLTYSEGEELDLDGLVVNAVYTDGRKQAVTDYVVSGFESVKGTYTITVTYRLRKASFTITVN